MVVTEEGKSWKTPLRAFARFVVRGAAWTVLGCQGFAAIGLLGHWPLELFTHWIPLGLLASLALLPFTFWVRLHASSTLLLASAIFATWILWPWLSPNGAESAQETNGLRLRVAVSNLCEHAEDHGTAAAWLAEARPDVVVLLEFEPESLEAFGELIGLYPHRVLHPQSGPLGFAVLSNRPLLNPETFRPGIISQLDTLLVTEAGLVRLLVAHPYAHATPYRHAASLRSLDELARRARKDERPVLLAGDLNLTPWSRTFQRFLQESRLRDPRLGRGLANTWPLLPAFPGLLDWFGVPIDHVLPSHHFTVEAWELGPRNGSDHLPLLVTLSLPSASS